MSSVYTRSKEFTRNRKSQSDSPPASPSPTAKTLRVSSLFLFTYFVIVSKLENVFIVTRGLGGEQMRFKTYRINEGKMQVKGLVSCFVRS